MIARIRMTKLGRLEGDSLRRSRHLFEVVVVVVIHLRHLPRIVVMMATMISLASVVVEAEGVGVDEAVIGRNSLDLVVAALLQQMGPTRVSSVVKLATFQTPVPIDELANSEQTTTVVVCVHEQPRRAFKEKTMCEHNRKRRRHKTRGRNSITQLLDPRQAVQANGNVSLACAPTQLHLLTTTLVRHRQQLHGPTRVPSLLAASTLQYVLVTARTTQ
jgi:hypothetical protein